MLNNYIVITTINEKTDAVKAYEKMPNVFIINVGDKKTPFLEDSDNSRFVSVDSQADLGYKIFHQLPYNHYCRKNIGYLIAMQSGADVIYDTDDDNLPLKNWALPDFKSSLKVDSNEVYVNIYKYFTGKKIWPRGFPLNQINNNYKLKINSEKQHNIAVWQGMANGDPDVDAIYRLVDNEPVTFDDKLGAFLGKGCYCPFNSQNTFWKKDFFPLLYLPSTVSFRYTDILRGYIAQRVAWDYDHYLGFMKATVFQDRNDHDYMVDFKDEVEVYLSVEKLVEVLSSIELHGDMTSRIRVVYVALINAGIVKPRELKILDAWLLDYKNLQ